MKNKTLNLLLMTTIGCNLMHAKIVIVPDKNGIIGPEQTALYKEYTGELDYDGFFELGRGTKVIAKDAFKDFEWLLQVEVEDTHSVLDSIDERAFQNCKALWSVLIPVKEIKDYAFEGCDQLETTGFSKELQSIGTGAFKNCSKFDPYFEKFENVITLGEEAFSGCVTYACAHFPGITRVPKNAFKGCNCMFAAYFPKATEIDEGAFVQCPIEEASFSYC